MHPQKGFEFRYQDLLGAISVVTERVDTQGGYSVWERVPTAVRLLESSGCRDPRQLKKGGCPHIIL